MWTRHNGKNAAETNKHIDTTEPFTIQHVCEGVFLKETPS